MAGDGSGFGKAVCGVLDRFFGPLDPAKERAANITIVHGCQLVTIHVPPPPVKLTPVPQRPWEDLALDILDPLLSGENLLVLVDYHSRWIEVDVVKATTSKIIIQRLDVQPKSLRTDNDPNLVSNEFEDYLKEMGVEHRHTTPLWPRANGEVERQNRTLLKAIREAHAEGKNWRGELNKFLLAYRSTPQSTTGKSPAELLFRRVLNTKMSELTGLDEEEADISDQGATDRHTQKKQENKDYVDKNFHAKERDVREGDLVLLEQKRQNKLSSSYEKYPYEVMTRYRDQVNCVEASNGGEYRTNMQHIKPFNIPDHEREASHSELGCASTTAASASATQVMAPTPVTPITTTAPAEIPRSSLPPAAVETPPGVPFSGAEQLPPLKRSGRVTRRPKTLSDYVLN